MAIGIAAIALWMGVNALSARRWRVVVYTALAVAAAAALSLLLYSAVLGQSGWNSVASTPHEWHSIKTLATAVFDNWNRTAPHPLDWLVAAAFVASLVLHRRIAKQPLPLAATVLVVLVGVAIAAPIAPFVRSWLFLLPLYLIAASGGAAWATKRLGPPAPVLSAGVLRITMLHAGPTRSDTPPPPHNHTTPPPQRHPRPQDNHLFRA